MNHPAPLTRRRFPARAAGLAPALAALLALLLGWVAPGARANMVTNAWQPQFKGIDHMVGTNYPDTALPRRQVMHCLRIDLTDPDIQLLTTPPASALVNDTRETVALTVTNFLLRYGVQAVINGNYYSPGDPASEGSPVDVLGFNLSRGTVVSQPDTGHTTTLFFTSNNVPGIVWSNAPPGTNTAGMYTAVTGFYPLVSNGVNIAAAAVIAYPDTQDGGDVHLAKQPRSVYGLSADRHYLYLLTIDGGPQTGYSEGALDVESAAWMLLVGGWDAINLDGGHSTAMYRADPFGKPVAYNHSNALVDYGRERYIGSHFGIYAAPYLGAISWTTGYSSATVAYSTVTNATVRIVYGPTTNYGLSLPPDTTGAVRRSATLTGLGAGATNYYLITATVGTNQWTAAGALQSLPFLNSVTAVPGQFTAALGWATAAGAASQVQYGLTTNYDFTTPLDPRLTTNHSVALGGLQAGATYYYRVLSAVGTNVFAATGLFTTTISTWTGVFGVTNSWRYYYTTLDGVNWTSPKYSDLGWSGPGPGLLWVDTRGAAYVPEIAPKNTGMPSSAATGQPYPTYYLRTHFNFPGPVAGASLMLSNFVDDGAIFYLNGGIVYNLRLGAPPQSYTNKATGYACASLASSDPCNGNACTNCADVFTLPPALLTNLVVGDNVLAVEIHNYTAASPDITFGTALFMSLGAPAPTPPAVTLSPAGQWIAPGGAATLFALASGDLPLAFQWRLNGTPLAGATNNVLNLTNLSAAGLGSYDVVVTNAVGQAVSAAAVLQTPAAPQISQVTLAAGGGLNLAVASQAGVGYVVEFTAALAPAAWAPVATNAATGSTLNFALPAAGPWSGFYRVRVQ